MNVPHQFGQVQLALLVLALIAIFVLIRSLIKPWKRRSLKAWKPLKSLLSLVIAAIMLSLLYASIMIQSYTGLTNDVRVAHIHASPIANSPAGAPMMSVDLTLYSPNGEIASEQTYLVKGDEWMVQSDIVKVSSLLGMVGLHSGCKLTRLEGLYNNSHLESNAKHSVIPLNDGDDTFFQWTRLLNGVLSPFIDGEYGNAVIDGAGTYNIYASQTSLWAQKA